MAIAYCRSQLRMASIGESKGRKKCCVSRKEVGGVVVWEEEEG
jgi:hypothetical protein